MSTEVIQGFADKFVLTPSHFSDYGISPALRVPQRISFCECLGHPGVMRFIQTRDQLPRDLQPFLDCGTAEEYLRSGTRLFLAANGMAGYGLRGRELVSVFSLPRAGLGRDVVAHAVSQGAQELTCLDVNGKLPRLYSQFGFSEISRAPWNEQLAPAVWRYERWGRPDYVTMRRVNGNARCAVL